MPKQREIWKQDTPAQQLHTIFMVIEGNFHNFKEGLLGREKFQNVMDYALEQFQELLYFNDRPEEWVPFYSKEKKDV